MILDQSQLAASAILHPEIKAYIAANPLPPVDPTDHLAIKKGLQMFESRASSRLEPTPSGITEIYHPITMRDGSVNTAKITKPASAAPGPLFILGHAGGFVGGSNGQLTAEARALARLFGATTVSLSYRLAPEHKFPTQQLDVWDACKWISDNATGPLLNADPQQGFVLGGVSVGGSMAAALSRKFQEQPLSHPLTGQWLCVASLVDDDSVPVRFKEVFVAREQSSEAPLLNKTSLEYLKRWSGWDPESDLRYAVNSVSDISQQPRTYLQVGALDPYRDDTLVYDELLREAGVETRLDFYTGCPHLHWMVMPDLEISKRTRADTLVGLGWLLGRDLDRGEAASVLGLSA